MVDRVSPPKFPPRLRSESRSETSIHSKYSSNRLWVVESKTQQRSWEIKEEDESSFGETWRKCEFFSGFQGEAWPPAELVPIMRQGDCGVAEKNVYKGIESSRQK